MQLKLQPEGLGLISGTAVWVLALHQLAWVRSLAPLCMAPGVSSEQRPGVSQRTNLKEPPEPEMPFLRAGGHSWHTQGQDSIQGISSSAGPGILSSAKSNLQAQFERSPDDL